MEKDIALGKVGALKLSFAGGKAKVEISVAETALSGSLVAQGGASVSLDAGALVDMIFAEVESKSPAGAAMIEESVKAIVKQAVLAIV